MPEGAPALELTLAAGALLLRADLLDARVETDLFKATADRGWPATFALLQERPDRSALTPLLRYQGRPFGAFAEWLARVPVLRGRAQGIVQFAEAEALTAPSGEVLAMLRAPGLLPREATVDAVAIGWLRAGDGLAEPALLPLADLHAARLPAALGCYARLSPAVLDRLRAVELLVAGRPAPGRGRVAALPAGFRDRAGTARRRLPHHPRALGPAGRGRRRRRARLLRQVIARREAAFGPTLHALAAPDAAAGSGLPRLALLLGVDDPSAARLFHVAAEEFERRCDTVLVMGTAAEDVVQAFARRGRIATLAGVAAAEALREAAGRAGVLAVEASAFAEAVIAGRPGDAFAQPLSPGDTARLLSLHAVAGCAHAAGRQPAAPAARATGGRRRQPLPAGAAPLVEPACRRGDQRASAASLGRRHRHHRPRARARARACLTARPPSASWPIRIPISRRAAARWRRIASSRRCARPAAA